MSSEGVVDAVDNNSAVFDVLSVSFVDLLDLVCENLNAIDRKELRCKGCDYFVHCKQYALLKSGHTR